jgi:L-amino acid N-acyltransferase YncA
VRIRQASPEDAAGIVAVWECIAAEKIYSAVDKPWSVEQQSSYLRSLSPREAFHVALDADGSIVGFQSLDLWSSLFGSMSHVGQVGTFLLPEWRRCGAGTALWEATRSFARSADYRKLVVQVRGSNTNAQSFYRRLGFAQCGLLAAQVIVDGKEDDEVLMELFLTDRSTD